MFGKRSTEKEIMDDLSFQGKEMDGTLKELRFINAWLGGNNVIIGGIEELIDKFDGARLQQPLRIADLGCGGGDMVKLMALWARRRKYNVKITGIDANSYIINYARKNTHAFPEIDYQDINVFSTDFHSQKFDVITCTLFCHHFDDVALLALLRQLKEQATFGIVINDLHRHWFAYYSIKWLTAFFSRSALVKNDVKLSVLRSFWKGELEELLRQAGFVKINIKWKWAFRFQVVACQ